MCLWLIRFIDLFCKIPEYLLLLGMFPFIFRTCLNNCSYVSCLCINKNPYALCIWEKQIEDLNLTEANPRLHCHPLDIPYNLYPSLAHSRKKPVWEAGKGWRTDSVPAGAATQPCTPFTAPAHGTRLHHRARAAAAQHSRNWHVRDLAGRLNHIINYKPFSGHYNKYWRPHAVTKIHLAYQQLPRSSK